MAELLGLFLAAFAAATLIPLPSEAALYAYLQSHPENIVLAVFVATIGNTAGGMTTYAIGRFIPEKTHPG
jgi:membrane protein YqaA with SNARE-associated domain